MQLSSWIHRALSRRYLFRTIDFPASVETWIVTFADHGIQRSAELEALYDVYMEQSTDFEPRESSAASTQDNSQDSTSSLQKVQRHRAADYFQQFFFQKRISHFRVAFYLCFKTNPGAQPVMRKWQDIERARKTHFNIKRSEPKLVLEKTWEKLGNGLLAIMKGSDLHSLSRDLGACDFRKCAARFSCWRQLS